MTEDTYRELARRLDALPNGFPPTASGVELRLLAKIFAPEEARLGSVMSGEAEPAATIAARAGVEAGEAFRTLKGMLRRGLVSVSRGQGHLVFALEPFVVGFYEAQLPWLDQELAQLFEDYYQESRGGILRALPALHRVIPIGQAIPFGIEIFPYERATELIENAKSWGVRDCICRVQQKLVGKGCARPVENCISFAPVEGVFDHGDGMRPITKEEALRILREAADAGLVHSTGNFRDGNSYICNCCTCCCGVLRGVADFGLCSSVAHSDFHAVVDDLACTGCESCVDRCQFHALAAQGGAMTVDAARCMGCGLCVTACPSDALHLERRSTKETVALPADLDEWRARRQAARNA